MISPPPLPLDLLIEIALRSDVVTVVRCAAACKPLRRAILDPQDFLRRRRLALRSAGYGGFDSALLIGISYELSNYGVATCRPVSVIAEPFTARFGDSPGFDAVASRDGLVVLRRHGCRYGPRIGDSITGETTQLPPANPDAAIWYPDALLTAGGRSSFELLVAGPDLHSQIYSSRDGRWSPVRPAKLPPGYDYERYRATARSRSAVVIGRTVHWLCVPESNMASGQVVIVALHADTAQATVLELPKDCGVRRIAGGEALTLAASADGRLSLVASEARTVSMWTVEPGQSSWSGRRVLMNKDRQWPRHRSVWFVGFGQRSGMLVIVVGGVGLVRLNLATGESSVVLHAPTHLPKWVCLHETNFAALLHGMKQVGDQVPFSFFF